MPFYLKSVDVVPEVAKFKSALIVLCRFCPAASLAVRNRTPFLEVFRRLLKTEPYEEHITDMQSRLGKEGVQTKIFKGGLRNFMICMWTSGQREKLLKLAPEYEAVMVMGCDGAYQSVCEMIKSTDCRMFHGMESEGVMNAIPKFHFPFNISLELFSVTPVIFQKKE